GSTVNGRETTFAGARTGLFGDLASAVTVAVKRRMANCGIEEFMNGTDTSSRDHVFATDTRKACLQVDQKLDLALGARRETGQAALGREHAVLPAIPEKKGLTQSGAHRHHRARPIRLWDALVEHGQV